LDEQTSRRIAGGLKEDMVRFIVWLCVCLCLITARPVGATAADAPVSPEAALARAKSDLRAVSSGLDTKTLGDADIEARLAAVPPIQARIASALAALTPRQQDLQARLAQLGPPPAAAVAVIAEDPRTVQARRDIAALLAAATADVQEARLLALTASQVSATLADRQRENFSARLWTRSRSILDPGLWRDFAAALPDDMRRVAEATGDEIIQAAPARRIARSVVIGGLAVAFSLFLLGPSRLILNRVGYARAARAPGVPRFRRIGVALWLLAVATATPLLAGWLLREALIAIDVMTPVVDRLTALFVQSVVFAAFLEGLGRAVLSPGRPRWRLAPIPDAMVRRLAPFPGLVGATAALTGFVAGVGSILGASLASRVAGDCIAVLLELAAVGGALAAVGRARVDQKAASADAVETSMEVAPGPTESRLPWILATLAAWAAVGAALLAVLAGYLALASFLMRETVWIAAILALLFLLLRLADDLFPTILSPSAPLGSALETALGLTDGSMDQVGVLLSGLTRLLLILVAWVALLVPFGASIEDIVHRFTATDFVVRLGLVAISPGAVLGGVALFLAGLAITRGVRRWLEVRYLPKTTMDVGLRTSLAAGVTYLGALIAILAAFAYLGLSIAQIALFASALSVGIGFGLQAIIGNFVSGLILLAERPVRVGDWIAIGDLEGDVRKINIRATEIEMVDRSRLIVPNSELVSKAVRNITHAGALGRIKITLKLDGSAEPGRVHDLMMARLSAHPLVLADPAPAVFMTDVRDGALEFTAFAYVASPRLAFAARSQLLFEIVPDLRAAGVALASPSPTIRVETAERPVDPRA
jgi:potassium efflux system protein